MKFPINQFFTILFIFYLHTHAQTIHQKILVDSLILDLKNEYNKIMIKENKIIGYSYYSQNTFTYSLDSSNLEFYELSKKQKNENINISFIDNNCFIGYMQNKRPKIYYQSLKNNQTILFNNLPITSDLSFLYCHFNTDSTYHIYIKLKINKSYIKLNEMILNIHANKLKKGFKYKIPLFFPKEFFRHSNYLQISFYNSDTIFINYCYFPINYLYSLKNQSLIHVFINPIYDNSKIRYFFINHRKDIIRNLAFTYSGWNYSEIKFFNEYIYQIALAPLSMQEFNDIFINESENIDFKHYIYFWDKNFKDLGYLITDHIFLGFDNDFLYEYKQNGSQYTIYKYQIIWNHEYFNNQSIQRNEK